MRKQNIMYLISLVGFCSPSCLPEGHPPKEFGTINNNYDINLAGTTHLDSKNSDIKEARLFKTDVSKVDIQSPDDISMVITKTETYDKEIKIDDSDTDYNYNEITWEAFTMLNIPYKPDENTVVLLHFDEPNPLENLGTLSSEVIDYGTTSTTSADGFAQARHFDGSGYLQLTKDSKLDLTGALTLEALIRPLFLQDSFSDSFGNVVSKAAGSEEAFQGYIIFIGNEYVGASLGVDGFNQITALYDLPTDKFTHIALTYDGNKMKLYIDQKLKAEKSVSNKIYTLLSADLFIGWSNGNGFIGDIDEVRLSDIAREF